MAERDVQKDLEVVKEDLSKLRRALYLYLAIVLGQATATLVIGLVTLSLAGGSIWSARRLSR